MGEIFLLEILRRCPRELQNTLLSLLDLKNKLAKM